MPYAHAKQFKRLRRLLKRQRTILGRLLRDVQRKASAEQHTTLSPWLERIARLQRQKPKDRNKLYALHAPEVECICKGKARNPYEFGVKVGLAVTAKQGLIVGARSFPGNPYDGDTLAEQIEQVAILTDVKPRHVIVDLGFRGRRIDGIDGQFSVSANNRCHPWHRQGVYAIRRAKKKWCLALPNLSSRCQT
jgi:IS5 family transposase